MSDLTQAVEISGGIFALMMATQFGTRRFGPHKVVLPIVGVVGFGHSYLETAPTDGHSLGLYAVGALIGLVFAALTYFATAMWVDPGSGSVMTRCGGSFTAVWMLAMLVRVGFVWAVTDVSAFRDWFGVHLMSMNLTSDAVAPFFVIWALTMVLGRVLGLLTRSRALRDHASVKSLQTVR